MDRTIVSKKLMRQSLMATSTATGNLGKKLYEYSEMLRKLTKSAAFGVSKTTPTFNTISLSHRVVNSTPSSKVNQKLRVKLNGTGLLDEVKIITYKKLEVNASKSKVVEDLSDDLVVEVADASTEKKPDQQQQQQNANINLEVLVSQFVDAVHDARFKLHLQKQQAWEKFLGTSVTTLFEENNAVTQEMHYQPKEAEYFRTYGEQLRGAIESVPGGAETLGFKPWEVDVTINPDKNPLKPEPFEVSCSNEVMSLEENYLKFQEQLKKDGVISEVQPWKEVRVIIFVYLYCNTGAKGTNT